MAISLRLLAARALLGQHMELIEQLSSQCAVRHRFPRTESTAIVRQVQAWHSHLECLNHYFKGQPEAVLDLQHLPLLHFNRSRNMQTYRQVY